MAESVSPICSVLVTAAGVDDILVFLQVFVDIGHEGRINLVYRQYRVPVYGIALHLIGHLQGVGKGLRVVREQGKHLFFRLDVLLLGIAQAIGIVNIGVGCEANKAVVYRSVLFAHKVGVVGSYDLNAVLLGQFEDFLGVEALFLVQIIVQSRHLCLMLHDLQVIILPKDPFMPQDGLFHGLVIVRQDGPGHFSGHTGTGADKAFVVLFYHLVAHPRAVIHAVDMPFGNDFYQVQVAGIVLGQENQVVIPLFLEPMVSLGHINLTADDGLHVRVLFGVFEELFYAIHIAMVRNGKGRHPQFIGSVEEVFYGGLSVQDGVLGVDMKVYETHVTKIANFPQKKPAGRNLAGLKWKGSLTCSA